MLQIIKDGQIQTDSWIRVLSPEDNGFKPDNDRRYLLPLEIWLTAAPNFSSYTEMPAVVIPGDADLDLIVDAIRKAPLIAIEFGAFTDGSGFSTASLLREKYGYDGELRAMGAVLPDQAAYLMRCGFSSMFFADKKDLELAVLLLASAGATYQGSVDRPRTPFQKRFTDRRSG